MPLDEAGLVAQVTHNFRRQVTASAGFDLRDVRATDDETVVSGGVGWGDYEHERRTSG